MKLILKIAWRNVVRHKGKSIIIGIIMFIGALLMTVGNGVVSGMDRGIEANIVNGFMGNVVVLSDSEQSDNVLFKMYGQALQTIGNYKDIKKVLQAEKNIENFLPVGRNAALIIHEDDGEPGYLYLIGADFREYKKMFPGNLTKLEGRLLNDDETGVLIPTKGREEIYNWMNIWFVPGKTELNTDNLVEDAKAEYKKGELNMKDNAVFMGMNDDNSTFDIRVSVRGVFKYRALNEMWGHFGIMDIESYRRCLGYFSAADKKQDISKQKKELLALESDDLDSMFSSDSLVVTKSGSSDISGVDFKRKELGTTRGIDLEAGTYNLVFVKVKDGTGIDETISRLNRALSKSKLGVHAVHWTKASGFIGSLALIIKSALFVFVMIIFIVAVIIIVNTLTMTAIERTPEIGMMRAVGAQKSFISQMFLGETVILAGVFGGIGIIVGIIVVAVIPLFEITTTNDMLQLLYGGNVFSPYLSAADILLAAGQLVFVTLVTVIYPIKIARSITPLNAITRE